jgi:leader peptidase (prepilin peptidase)/N-methyltransferase
LGLLTGFVIAAAVAVVLLISRRATRTTALPFGPALILGALLVLATTHP